MALKADAAVAGVPDALPPIRAVEPGLSNNLTKIKISMIIKELLCTICR